jgi:peroxiredoxin
MRLRAWRTLAVLAAVAAFGAEVPRPAPDLAIPLPSGQSIRTADCKGKIVVVEFLLTSCPGCQNAARILTRLRAEYASRGFEVIGVATNADAEKDIGNFIRKTGATFPVGHRTLDDAKAYLQIPAASSILVPQLVFIDRTGAIRSQHGSEDQFFFLEEERNIRREIEALLSENKAPAKAARAAVPARPRKP